MNAPKFQQHGGDQAGEPSPHRPYWKRIHHSPFFWVAAASILLAMTIYVMTNNLSVAPRAKIQQATPAIASP